MLFSKYSVVASALVSGAVAKTIPIQVGNGALTFSPNNVTAAKGDILDFTFYPKNHTVTQGSFTTPCSVGTVTGAAFSGFMPVTSGTASMSFQVTVNETTPMWFFCSQNTGTHCQEGMSMVVNEVSTGPNTLAAYQAAAKLITAKSEIPTAISGGAFVAASASNTTSAGSSSTSSATTSSATSSKSASAAGAVIVSPFNMVAAGFAAVGAFAFSAAL